MRILRIGAALALAATAVDPDEKRRRRSDRRRSDRRRSDRLISDDG